MHKIIAVHKKDYETTDLERQLNLYDKGLRDDEKYYIDKYFNPSLPTLEIGTGGGRVVVALEKGNFNDLTAIDLAENIIEHNIAKGVLLNSRIKYQFANATNLPFADEAFDQVICVGFLISHLPNRDLRIKALRETYRVMRPNALLLINSHNIYFKPYIFILRAITRAIRFFYNPLNYSPNDLPRLGARSGKLDYLFFRPTKSQLHYYYPAELVYDLLSIGFVIIDMNFSGQNREIKDHNFHFFKNNYLNILAKKII
jgi:SAM-dependent methyltransferase